MIEYVIVSSIILSIYLISLLIKIGKEIFNLTKEIKEMEQNKDIYKENKKELQPNQFLVNGEVYDQDFVYKLLSEYILNTYVFRNSTVYLPVEKPLPVKNVKKPNLNYFKNNNMNATHVLVSDILNIGIKIGREMEKNDSLEKLD